MTGSWAAISTAIGTPPRTVAVASVEQAKGIVGASNGYFRCVGSTDRALTADEIRERLARQSAESALTELSRAVAQQTEALDRLGNDFSRTNSVWRKLGIGAVGAVLGALLKIIVEHLWRW
jgi:hypothetical protein